MKRASLAAFIFALIVSVGAFAGIIRNTGSSSGVIDTGVPASYTTGHFGAVLENEANADPNTVMFCDISNPDGTTSNPLCAISGVKHTGVGPLSPSNSLSMDENTMRYAGDFRTCHIVEAVSLAVAAQLIVASDAAETGYGVILKTNGAVEFSTFAAGPTSTVSTSAAGGIVVGQKNLVCYGRNGTDQILSVNGVNTTTPNTKTVATTNVVYIGTDYAFANTGSFKLYEMVTSAVAATTVYFDSVWTAATTCRSAGRCLPAMTGEQIYLTGEEYLIGSDLWCGDAGACAIATTFSAGSRPMTAKSRYNWPSLAWTQVGTVPRVASSPVYPQGYGAARWWLGGFDGSNELEYDNGFAAPVFTFCMDVQRLTRRFSGDSGTTLDTLISATNDSSQGWKVTSVPEGAYTFHWYDAGGTLRSVATSGTPDSASGDRRLCFGHDGAAGWIAATGGTPQSASFTFAAWSAGSMTMGGVDATVVWPGEVAEWGWTTTAPTSAYLAKLVSEPCTVGGSCLPRDANTQLACDARNYDFGTKTITCAVNTVAGVWSNPAGTITKTQRQSVPMVEIKDANGAGPFSDANYFTNGTGSDVLDMSEFSCCASINPTALATTQVILSDGQAADTGWYIYSNSSTSLQTVFASPAASATIAVGAENIYCWGRAGTTGYAKANGGTIATADTTGWTPGTTRTLTMGRYSAVGGYGATTTAVRSLWCSSTPAGDALFTKIQRRFLNHAGTQDQPITATRTADGTTTHASGQVWYAPGNVLRQTDARRGWSFVNVVNGASQSSETHATYPPGKVITGGITNNAFGAAGGGLDPTQISVTGVVATANAALAPDGTMTATTVREDASNGTHIFTYSLPRSSACPNYYEGWSWYIRPVNHTYMASVNWTGATYKQVTHDATNGLNALGTSVGAGENPAVFSGHEHLADGWMRMWIFGKCSGYLYTYVALLDELNGYASSYAGNTANGFDVWGPMHHYTVNADTLSLAPYCGHPSSGAVTCNADTVTVANPLRPNGADWTNYARYTESLCTVGVTNCTAEYAIGPDLSFTADRYNVATALERYIDNRAAGALNGRTFTLSAYCKANAGTPSIYMGFTDTNAWLAGQAFQAACALTTGEYTRCSVTGTYAGAIGATAGLVPFSTAGRLGNPDLAAADFSCWGLQFVEGAAPQPYCPNLGNTASATCGPGGATGKVTVNVLAQNTTMQNAAWSLGAGTAVFDNDSLCPVDPTNASRRMNRVTSSSIGTGGDGVYQTTASKTLSGYLALVTGDATCKVGLYDATTGSGQQFDITSTPTRYQYSSAGASAGFWTTTRSSGTCARWCVSGAQSEATVTAAGPYCGPTGATAKTCAPQQRWCVRVKDATPTGRGWNSSYNALLYLGGIFGPYTDGYVYWDPIIDGVAWSHRFQANYAAGSTHTITLCVNDGVTSMYSDGVAQVITYGGAGGTTPVLFKAWPATVSIGHATYPWNGTIGGIDFNTTGNPKDFAP